MSELEQDTQQQSISSSAEIKRKNRTLEEREAFHKLKAKQLHQKIASRERKERTHRLIEIGAFVESTLKTSTKEEAISLIKALIVNYNAVKKFQDENKKQ